MAESLAASASVSRLAQSRDEQPYYQATSGSGDKKHSTSRRKQAKTRKVATDVDGAIGYDEYLKQGIPDALLEGLGFNEHSPTSESGSPRSSDDIPDDPPFPVDHDDPPLLGDHDASINTAVAVVSPRKRLHTASPKKPKNAMNGVLNYQTPSAPLPITLPAPILPNTNCRGRPPKAKQLEKHPEIAVPLANDFLKSTFASGPLLPISPQNVGQILEKMLAATQSMGMLLGSLKDDLRRMSLPSVVTVTAVDMQSKRREAAAKLWRAFIAYRKSFDDIETFSKSSGIVPTPPSSAAAPPPSPALPAITFSSSPSIAPVPLQPSRPQNSRHQKQVSEDPPFKSSARITAGASKKQTRSSTGSVAPRSDFLLEHSDSDFDEPPARRKKKQQGKPEQSSPRTVEPSDASFEVVAIWDKEPEEVEDGTKGSSLTGLKQSEADVRSMVRSLAVQDAKGSRDMQEKVEEKDGIGRGLNDADNCSSSCSDTATSTAGTPSKIEHFGSLLFEPLFEITPVNSMGS